MKSHGAKQLLVETITVKQDVSCKSYDFRHWTLVGSDCAVSPGFAFLTRIDDSTTLPENSTVSSLWSLSTIEVWISREKIKRELPIVNKAEKFLDAAIPRKLLKGQDKDTQTQ